MAKISYNAKINSQQLAGFFTPEVVEKVELKEV